VRRVSARVDYGLDAPRVVAGNAVGGALGLAAAWIVPARLRGRSPRAALALAIWAGGWGTVALAQAGLMLRSSRSGKLRERDRLLDGIPWRGDDVVLDVGCGRGLLLIGAAHRVPAGWAIGLDLWRNQDQAGNDPAATYANARAEGVADRVTLRDGDARALPFDDASFDVVLSSLALHNVTPADDRATAVREIARVLKPGGHVAILDFRSTAEYASVLADAGLTDVRRSPRRLSMHPPVRIVTATRR
jgi:SAM-dependent methyltransferase